MKDFIEKWKSDKKYQTKIKLIAYTSFVLIISIYAISINNSNQNITNLSNNNTIEDQPVKNTQNQNTTNIINIPNQYSYLININIDDAIYKYSGEVSSNNVTIIKEIDDNIINYVYKNNNYYILDEDNYIITTKEEVYNVINYNYIDLNVINKYLEKAEFLNNQYLVYLKDIILNYDSDKYFTIIINDKDISIDYTNLMREFNNNITKYIVDIKYEDKEWKRWTHGKR